MTTQEREALAQLVLGARAAVEAAHATLTGVLMQMNAAAEPAPPGKKRGPRFMGDTTDNESRESDR